MLPAIDLLGGRVVRLRQGDFEQETAYDDDPVGVALALVEAGARWLHVVDLDGARSGEPRQADVVGAIVSAIGETARCEVAGGLRSEAAVDAALDAGAARVVIGTAALRDPTFAARLIARHGHPSIVAAIDVRDGLAVGGGWLPGAAGVPAEIAIARLADVGVSTFEATAIASDGRMDGPDLELLRAAPGAAAEGASSPPAGFARSRTSRPSPSSAAPASSSGPRCMRVGSTSGRASGGGQRRSRARRRAGGQ